MYSRGIQGRAVVEQLVELSRLVKDHICPQRQASTTDFLGRVVRQDHDALMSLTVLTRPQNSEPRALLQEQIYNGEVPVAAVGIEPSNSVSLPPGNRNYPRVAEFLKGRYQAAQDGWAVFNKKGLESHAKNSVGQTLRRSVYSQDRRSTTVVVGYALHDILPSSAARGMVGPRLRESVGRRGAVVMPQMCGQSGMFVVEEAVCCAGFHVVYEPSSSGPRGC